MNPLDLASAVTSPIALFFLIAAATFVSEDLTCVAAGILVARGALPFAPATGACLLGIFSGDVGLYLIGRLAGGPLSRLVPAGFAARASGWMTRHVGATVLGSRFLPGTRVPTYVAAGALRAPAAAFAGWMLLAAAIWTPLVVGLSAGLGGGTAAWLEAAGAGAGLALGGTALAGAAALRLATLAATYRGRRRLAGAWARLARWEFWPLWAVYPPVVLYILWLGVRHRGLTLFTAANPGMPAGGFVGESKSAILAELARGGAPVARFRLLPGPEHGSAARLAGAEAFLREEGLEYPVVLKPDVGQRGSGVAVVRGPEALRAYLEEHPGRTIVQEHVPGVELGVFYYRFPGEPRGRILSITDKRMPVVTGDGRRTLERLILDDRRAVALAGAYCRAQQERLGSIPAAGERIQLVEIGTHCRGAIFLDGGRFATPALERAVDRMGRAHRGFHFGRFDLRAPSEDAFRRGEELRIVELNGVTSESTDIYDPRHGLLDAWRILFSQWRLAFEIGRANRRRGVRPTPLLRLVHKRSGI